ncbi:MAG TPA: tetratricopeptide repeat protein, partial [Magnetococcales bacterium]|nr:tetratricopeptide repeat protein [Magnetococcales bacterium]
EAEKVFQQALARDPDDVHIRTELGRLLLMRKRWNEAEKYFQQTLALDPRNGIALAHLKDLQPLRERYEDDGNEILEMLISGYEETVDGNSSVGQKLTDEEKSEYRIFRAPGLAKREDFFIGLRGEGWEPLAQKAKERLGDLLVSDGQNGVVKFFAWRHGLLPRLTKAGETAYTGAQSWSMLEEFAQEENIENRTQKAESLVCHLPGRLRLLVQAAAGKREGWQSLVQWFESVRNHSPKEQSRDLSDASDQFLFNQMRRMILTGVALDPDIMPADSLMRDMCRETAEYLLPSGTEPVVCSETQNLLLA